MRTWAEGDGMRAELTSVPSRSERAEPALVVAALEALRWRRADVDPAYPIDIAAAGARLLVLVTRTRERLAEPDYDFETWATLMREHGLITLQLVWPESPKCYHAHNPFAGCGVRTPANGAAAAALAGYLRVHGKVREDATFIITQGVDMGRPSEIVVRRRPG